MGSVVQLTDAPPCPTCGRAARELETTDHTVDLYIDPLTTFNVAARQWSYNINPCGHEVAGFKADATTVLEWSTVPY